MLRTIVVVVVVVSEIIRYSSLLVTPKSTVEKRRRKNYLQDGDYMDQEKEYIPKQMPNLQISMILSNQYNM